MLTITEVAAQLQTDPAEVLRLAARGDILVVRRGDEDVVPERFLDGVAPVKHGGAVLRLLLDGGRTPEEALAWMSIEDPTLPGSAFDALHEDRATEVKRRAQAAAF